MARPGKAFIRPRLIAALLAARAAATLIRALRRGGGTVMPGHVAARLHPGALADLAGRLVAGTVLISGTNGKTTTARMLSSIGAYAELDPIHNRAGANLPAGILSALVDRADLRGRLRGKLGLFEVDEAHVPTAVKATHPRILVLTNLFRDQLDRYGEIDLIAKRWRETVDRSGSSLTLAANIDDPLLADLIRQSSGPTLSFGIEERTLGSAVVPRDADRRLCPACSGRLHYSWCYYGHLGHYACDACGWQRPPPDLAVTGSESQSDEETAVHFEYAGRHAVLHLALPGLHNVYNAAAALATALALGLDLDEAVTGLGQIRGAFGRHERISVGAGSLILVLVKNPVGFNQALRSAPLHLDAATIAINDRLADGTDVSWLWDVDFQPLIDRKVPLVCSGLRAHDMALRLKYDGASRPAVVADLVHALDQAVLAAEGGAQVAFFSTYTATLEVQRLLARRGLVPPFWET